MERTPDEIKKRLEYSFKSCWTALEWGDPLGYPQAVVSAYEALGNALDFIQQLEAERDAAVADVRLAYTSYVGACQTCKRVKDQVDCDNPLGCGRCGEEKCKCNTCDNDYSNWEWRGVQKEE